MVRIALTVACARKLWKMATLPALMCASSPTMHHVMMEEPAL